MLERHLTHWKTDARFPRIIVEHPIQNVTPEALVAKAEAIAEQIMAHLPP